MVTLRGKYNAERRNGGYFIKIYEGYQEHQDTVSKADWSADITTLRSMHADLDSRVEVLTQDGTMVWRFAYRPRDINTGGSGYFEGRAQQPLKASGRE